MRYLSFDLECAKTYGQFTPICNFGYTIYNTNNQLIEQKDILINPRTTFKLEGRTGRPDVKLFYSKDEYEKAPTFDKVYQLIKSLLEQEDQLIVNHAIKNDIEYLQNECRRYKLPMIEFFAYDTLDAYKAYSNSKKSISLDQIVETYKLGDDFTHHRADEDAKAALEFFLKVCKMMEIDPIDLIDLAQMKKYKSTNILSKKSYMYEKDKILKHAQNIIVKSEFFEGKSVSLSMSLEENIDIFEGIVNSIHQLGGTYTPSVSSADYFIYQDDRHCKRCDSFIYKKDSGSEIIGLTYDEYQQILMNTLLLEINR